MSGMNSSLRKAAGAALCVGALALTVGGAELALRLYQYQKFGISLASDANHGLFRKDEQLGWKLSGNLKYRAHFRDALNRNYVAEVQTDGHGFRLFGNPGTGKKKVLIVGDSFTAALDVGNDATYYGSLQDALPQIEVFAYGAGGYGTLQEYQIIDEFLDLVKPDLIIVQFYENDFLDNDPELDILKSFYNSGMPRPYLDPAGTIVSRYATYDGVFLKLPAALAKNLRLLRVLNSRLGILASMRAVSPPGAEPRYGVAPEGLRRSERTTQAILERLVRRAGDTPVCLFNLTDRQPYDSAIRRLCATAGVRFIDGVAQRLAEHERREPYSTKAADREHLNETGNRLVAESLEQFLRQVGNLR